MWLVSLPLLLGAAGALTPGELFVRDVVRGLGAVETTCYRKIQLLQQSMREKEPQKNFRVSCATLTRESSNLQRVQEVVTELADREQPQGLSALLLEDWTRHETFGISYSVKYRVSREGDQDVAEQVIVWWHPATRLLEFRIWNAPPTGSAPPDAALPESSSEARARRGRDRSTEPHQLASSNPNSTSQTTVR